MTNEDKRGIIEEGAQTGSSTVTPPDVRFFFFFAGNPILDHGNKFLQPVAFGSTLFEEEDS